MDESETSQNRRTRRSNVLMTATLELSGVALPVKLRNLSAEGALVEGDTLPVDGAQLLFCKGDLRVSGQVAWTKGRRAGITFARLLEPKQLLHHVPVPRPRVKLDFRRPGLATRALTAQERKLAQDWVVIATVPPLGD